MLNLDNFCHLSTRGACKNSNLIAKKTRGASRTKETYSQRLYSQQKGA